MDILSHALWAGALNKGLSETKKPKVKFSFWWSTFWGAFPDLFAFSLPFIALIVEILTGETSINNLRQAHTPENNSQLVGKFFNLSPQLYNYSHSLIIFAVVFLIAWAMFRKPKYVLLGWPLHILMDIFTHSSKFYPTPVFFPLSNWHFNGHPWSDPRILIPDYALLAIVYIYLFRIKKKNV